MLTTSETGRTLYGHRDLAPLFAPRSVVVVGASEKPGAFGGQVLLNALAAKELEVFAVNPGSERVHGVKTLRSISELPHPVDLAAICVPQAAAVGACEAALAKGIPSSVIFSSGFLETGKPEGLAAQERLAKASVGGLRMLGPNSLGFINFHRRQEVTFLPAYGTALRPGGIGIVAQSGAIGYLLTQAQTRGVGFSYWAAVGNACDIDALDAANFMLADENTSCVVLVLESVKDGSRVFELGRRSAEAGKPIIIYKMGDSEHGSRAAQSHTGALTGSAVVTRQAFRDAGLVVVEHFDEIIGTATLFSKYGRARGTGVGFISSSGGAGIIAADEAERAGVELPPLAPPTVEVLGKLLPDFASTTNPTDLTAEMVKNVPTFEECLRVFRRDPNMALILLSLTVATEHITGARAPSILRVAGEESGAPLGVVWFSEWLDGPGASAIETHPKLAMFRSARVALTCVRYWLDWSSRPSDAVLSVHDHSPGDAARRAAERARSFLAPVPATQGRRLLDEREGKDVLALLGIRSSTPVVVDAGAPQAAARALESIAYPAAVKVLDRNVLHKARIGGVKLNLANPREALGAALEMGWRLASGDQPAKTIVESMVRANGEWFLGARRDPAFGVVVTIGVGGGDVESRKPVLIVGTPTRDEIGRRIATAGAEVGKALEGRDQVASALADAAVNMLQLFAALPELEEVDVNPLMESADGLVAVDAVMIASDAR